MTDCVLAFDIGGSNLKAGLVDPSGNILKEDRLPLPENRDQALEALIHLAGGLAKQGECIGIGIGAPGVIDHASSSIAADANNLPQLVGARFDELFRVWDVPVKIDNDANNAARAEHLFGAARGKKNVLVVTLGTGIGGGLILNDTLYTGASAYAGEFGHMIVEARGRRCTCGGEGCLEAYAGAWALRLRAESLRKRFPESSLTGFPDGAMDVADMAAAARCGDTLACALMREAGEMLGAALASAANLLNFDAVVIGGGVSAAGDVLFEPMRASFRQRALPKVSQTCTLLEARLGNRSGLVGAAALIYGNTE
ncbi:MAG: ROK family protein [Spirochaetota bacterium]|jgi:glucokinase|nr:ROK family protein [Spirochaetota bacterium]